MNLKTGINKEEILTGIRFYQYHVCAIILLFIYSSYHIFFGVMLIGLTLSIAALINAALIIGKIYKKESILLRELGVLAIAGTIILACYLLGVRGLLWVFPLVVGIFFNYNVKLALPYSVIASLACLVAALPVVEHPMIVRMVGPLALTIGFAYLYRVTIDNERIALEKEANEDYLTGIQNRRSFQKWLKRSIQELRLTDSYLAVFYIDIDDFKLINDTHGHDVGDKVLEAISHRLVSLVRPTDNIGVNTERNIARIAGDEFVVATSSLQTYLDAVKIAERLLRSMKKPVKVNGLVLDICTSIGVALCSDSKMEAEALLADADAALHKSKAQGKNRITYFDERIADEISNKKRISQGLESAIRNKDFYLNFMPIFSSDGKTLCGAEVLIRCQSSELEGVGPDKYIPVAEESGLIRNIDLFVIEQTFAHFKQIEDSIDTDFKFAINISAKELVNDAFPEQLQHLVDQYQIPVGQIELELTETSLVSLEENSIDMLNTIKKMGFNLSLDDFGTGYTAFSQLQNYPVDTLKIDRSFVWNISNPEHKQKTMVDVILSLAKLYKVDVVAEGVENQEQLDYLKHAHCNYFQGFYLCKPVPWDEFLKLYFNRV